MNKIETIKVGDKITVLKRYVRKTELRRDRNDIFQGRWKIWVEKEIAPVDCFIIGIRTISNGRTESDPEVGTMYEAREHMKAILVVRTLYSKPFLIPLP